ncbi:MAG: hydrogenase maturation nickel metallochaperone HypA [Candidatus Methanomethylophilaceae archaeon]|nr:hydrogenase maturation nickel metallochaperone HypA [Candidatus Methanomethylophilaceae archaeon]
MHEVSVVSTLVKAVLKELENHRTTKVNRVALLIGVLNNLGEEQMRFAYEIVTRGTILEGSELVIEEEPVEAECRSCGYRGPVDMLEDPDFGHDIPVLACPRCHGPITVVKGQSCTVKYMDIEEE